MKLFLWLGAVGVFSWGYLGSSAADESWTVWVTGDTLGYLSPCGCTKPMSGGIRRRGAAIRSLSNSQRMLVLDNGGGVTGLTRQDEIKAETLAEAMKLMRVDAAALGEAEARLGFGIVGSLQRLSGETLLSSVLEPSELLALPKFKSKEAFIIGSVHPSPRQLATLLGTRFVEPEAAIQQLLDEAKSLNKVPLLLFQGTKLEAEVLAKKYPALALIVYRSSARPEAKPVLVGNTWLVSPGEKGKQILLLKFTKGEFREVRVIDLGPEYPDDPSLSRVYQRYQRRLDEEDLLGKLPRSPAHDAFTGSKACGNCHAQAAKVWQSSKHAESLSTLENDGHARDPDCVGCHVVGLDIQGGFRSKKQTPDLAGVGCESCHGAGAKHAQEPIKHKMGQVGKQSCLSCHNPNQSPGFDFNKYWLKIAH